MYKKEEYLPYLPTQHTNIKYKLKIPNEFIDFLLQQYSKKINSDIHESVMLHYLKYYPINKLLYIYTFHKRFFFTPIPGDYSLLDHYIEILQKMESLYFLHAAGPAGIN